MATAKAQDSAYAYLRKRILEGKLAPSTAIVPEDVGHRLGISRMPVRAALLQLEKEGLVTFGSNRRPAVTSLSAPELVELFEMRIALETLAIERAVANLKAPTVRVLEGHLASMRRASSEPQRWIRLHASFHDEIYSAAQMPMLLAEIRRIRQAIDPYLLLYCSAYGIPETSDPEHAELLRVLRKRDASLARSCLTEHIRTAASAVVYFILNKMNSDKPPMLTGGSAIQSALKPVAPN